MAIIQAQEFTCTPASLIESTPCLKCLSEKELMAALLGIYAAAAEKTVKSVLVDSACFDCLSKKQMLQALVTLAGNDLLGERNTVQDIIDEITCLECAGEKKILAALLYLLCSDIRFSARIVLV